MSDIAIRVDNVCKRYRLGEGQAFDNVRDAVAHAAKAPLRWLAGARNGNDSTAVAEQDEILWALRDVSFEVKRGEVLGIIGRNGAGKSTLLKILSRITEPSDGAIDVFGRVASLLEVGTGFHQDLTGRENIYLNGSILGMTKKEIDRKFDEIVAFAGVERFIDTPVKRYSSGMGIRLGFAVAAHLEPEILIVDEVLAVGDQDFQRRCLGKMDDVARSGRTILFVSHNMGSIADLCHRCIRLADGSIVDDGVPPDVIRRYLAGRAETGDVEIPPDYRDRRGEGPMRVTRVAATDAGGNVRSTFGYGEPITIRVGMSPLLGNPVEIGISIRTSAGHMVLHFSTRDWATALCPSGEDQSVELAIDRNVLNDGTYYVTVWLGGAGRLHDRVADCLAFDVSSSADGMHHSEGMIRVPASWGIAPSR